MKKKLLCVLLASAMALTVALPFAGCAKEKKESGSAYVASSLYPAVFFDDTGKNYVAEEDKSTVIELKKGAEIASYQVSATDLYGNAVQDTDSVAVFDEETRTVTAAGRGILNIDLCGEDGTVLERVSVTSQGAYPSDPSFDKLSETASDGVNGSHDPSIVEYDGYYYVLTTGWDTGGNQIRRSKDMIHWEKLGSTFSADSRPYSGKAPSGKAWTAELKEVANSCDAPGVTDVDYWAPDIIKCPNKEGFWLYSCAVYTADMGQNDGNDRACIFLCYSEDLSPGSYSYVGMIFQSCLPAGNAEMYINAIDPQIIFTPEGDMYMAYGSFHAGLFMIEMDPDTGLRKAGMNRVYSDAEVHAFNNSREQSGSDGAKYCGVQIASGELEAPVVARHDNVAIYDDEGNVTDTLSSRYYLMGSYGSLAATYNMRYGISDSVTGVYCGYDPTGDGGQMLTSSDGTRGNGYKFMGAYQFVYADGTAMSAKADYYDDAAGQNVTDATVAYKVYAPGHNDLHTTRGINIATRINRYDGNDPNSLLGGSFALFVNQYYLNSQGMLVINPNRYAGERARTVTAKEVAEITGGNYQMLTMQDSTSAAMVSQPVQLSFNGTDGGSFFAGGEEYTWKVFGDNFIKISCPADDYYGVVTPAWLEGVNKGGLTITAIGGYTGMSIYLNCDYTA